MDEYSGDPRGRKIHLVVPFWFLYFWKCTRQNCTTTWCRPSSLGESTPRCIVYISKWCISRFVSISVCICPYQHLFIPVSIFTYIILYLSIWIFICIIYLLISILYICLCLSISISIQNESRSISIFQDPYRAPGSGDGSNSVTMREWRYACRIYGFNQGASSLFKQLDAEGMGSLSLEQVGTRGSWRAIVKRLLWKHHGFKWFPPFSRWAEGFSHST